MSEEIIKVLDELAKRFGIVIDWTSQNIMPYLQNLIERFITYKNCTAIVWIFASICLIISGIIMTVKANKWRKSDSFNKKSWNDDELIFGLIILCAICLIGLGIVFTLGNTLGIIKNICMPELTIIEYIKGLNQ